MWTTIPKHPVTVKHPVPNNILHPMLQAAELTPTSTSSGSTPDTPQGSATGNRQHGNTTTMPCIASGYRPKRPKTAPAIATADNTDLYRAALLLLLLLLRMHCCCCCWCVCVQPFIICSACSICMYTPSEMRGISQYQPLKAATAATAAEKWQQQQQ